MRSNVLQRKESGRVKIDPPKLFEHAQSLAMPCDAMQANDAGPKINTSSVNLIMALKLTMASGGVVEIAHRGSSIGNHGRRPKILALRHTENSEIEP
jgi:hypothetical protein